MQARLSESEEAIESMNQKVMGLDKSKQRLSTELEDMQLEVERSKSMASAMEKRAKAFDKSVAEWKTRVDELAGELDNSQKECRNYSTELFRLRSVYDESHEQLDSVRRENKSLVEEIKDLMDQVKSLTQFTAKLLIKRYDSQIGDGGRAIHGMLNYNQN